MKILLIQDVYKLGRAGDVKKVADGYGRNYLVPQGLAVLATPGALKQVKHITKLADEKRTIINKEMSGIAELLTDVTLTFPAKAGETGKLYGSITSQMIVDSIQEEHELEINRRQIDSQPIRTIGMHKVKIRLTIDLIPEISVIVYREGETPEAAIEEAEALATDELALSIDAEAVAEELTEDVETAEAEAPVEEEVVSEGEPEAEIEAEVESETSPETESVETEAEE